jgi:DNA-directed RNA polymerase specialized sigma24 family protein
MRSLEDMSYLQIAAALGCSEATARTHVARASDRLQVTLARLEPNRATRS